MLKKLISICVIFSMCVLKVSASKEIVLSADCAVAINVQTGEVLYSKNTHQKHSMASTTKIMTALIAVESGKLQSEIIVTDEMVKVEGTSMGLIAGDSVSLEELVYGMMLSSGNDAANATAIYLGGSLDNFADVMNSRAAEIGMNNTNFVTPSGLDDEEHYSTAYDMALLGATAVKNPKFLSVCSAESATLIYGNPPYQRTLYNHNKLLDKYDYALGIKTGFTKKSGRCLVSYAKKGSAEVVAVTLDASDDWNDHCKLLDFCFGLLSVSEISPDIPTTIPVVGSDKDFAEIACNSLSLCFVSKQNVNCMVFINKFIYAPAEAGTIVGKCVYTLNSKIIHEEPIVLNEGI